MVGRSIVLPKYLHDFPNVLEFSLVWRVTAIWFACRAQEFLVQECCIAFHSLGESIRVAEHMLSPEDLAVLWTIARRANLARHVFLVVQPSHEPSAKVADAAFAAQVSEMVEKLNLQAAQPIAELMTACEPLTKLIVKVQALGGSPLLVEEHTVSPWELRYEAQLGCEEEESLSEAVRSYWAELGFSVCMGEKRCLSIVLSLDGAATSAAVVPAQ